MTDYLLFNWDTHPDPELSKVAYEKSQDFTLACWYDDYGWWGIATVKSFDEKYDNIFGEYKSKFQNVSTYNWKVMNNGKNDEVHLGTPNVWTNRDNQKYFDPKPPVPEYWATPRFSKGVGSGLQGGWQYDIYHNLRIPPNWTGPPECCGGIMAPSEDVKLGPYQMTVVNGLFFTLSLRLHIYSGQPSNENDYLSAALDEYGFLKAWFGRDTSFPPVSDVHNLLLFFSNDTGGLVRERVSTYASKDDNYPLVENWDPETCWTGDQGMILGSYMDYLSLYPHDLLSQEIITNVTLGVFNYLVGNESLSPWYPLENNKLEAWDAGDYKCGNGVFLRYLLHAYSSSNIPIVRNIIKGSQNIQDKICEFARSSVRIKQEDMFDSLNVLSTLIAANQLLNHPDECTL